MDGMLKEQLLRDLSNPTEFNNAIKAIADRFGIAAQLDQTVEEAAELIQAINKYKRATLNGITPNKEKWAKCRENMIEETADLQVMIFQLQYLLDFDIEDMAFGKVARQLKRIEDENGKPN